MTTKAERLIAMLKFRFGKDIIDLFNPKYEIEINEEIVYVYSKPGQTLKALKDISEYTRLNGTKEPQHNKGEIFITNYQEKEWLLKAGMAEEVSE